MVDQQRLVGGSFRGQPLDGADFSSQDLRGADFTGADLRSASFRDARLGVAPLVGAVILGGGIVVAVLAGLTIGWGVSDLRRRLSSDEWDQVAEGGTLATVFVLLVAIIIWKGFDLALRTVVIVYVVLVVVNVVANAIWDRVEYVRIVQATAMLVLLILAVGAGILGRVVGGVFGSWSIALVASFGGLATGRAEGGMAGIVVAVSLVIISKRAVRGDRRDRSLRRLAHRIVRRWGTQFVDADLSGADFTGADASGCDVRGATLADVRWDPGLPLPVDMPDPSDVD